MHQEFDPAQHSHRRFNPLSGQWVLVSPHRGLRPWQGQQEAVELDIRPSHDPKCYLCPGNVRVNGQRNADYSSCWSFVNDHSALLPSTPAWSATDDPLFQTMPALGECHVLCYSPDHSLSLPELTLQGVRDVVQAWCTMSSELGKKYRWVQVFENKGALMGCSQPHPHGQIWTTNYLPNEPAREDLEQRNYFARYQQPMLLDLAEREAASGERVVAINASWLAIVPYWAAWPFETLLLPRFAAPRFADVADAERDDLANILRQLTIQYDNLFACSFAYSMGWHTAPFDLQDSQPWQLHAHFYPPLLRSASVRKFMVGFEMLAEPQRDLTPEQAAARLREQSPIHYRHA